MNWFDRVILRKNEEKPVEKSEAKNFSDDEDWPVTAEIEIIEDALRGWSYSVLVTGPNGERRRYTPHRLVSSNLSTRQKAEKEAVSTAQKMARQLRVEHNPKRFYFEVKL